MHELAICQGLIGQVQRVAAENNAGGVTRISVAVGPLSGVEAALLQRAFTLARSGTIAESATLEIEERPVTVWCDACGIETQAEPSALLCGNCGTWRVELRSGNELVLMQVELTCDVPAEADC